MCREAINRRVGCWCISIPGWDYRCDSGDFAHVGRGPADSDDHRLHAERTHLLHHEWRDSHGCHSGNLRPEYLLRASFNHRSVNGAYYRHASGSDEQLNCLGHFYQRHGRDSFRNEWWSKIQRLGEENKLRLSLIAVLLVALLTLSAKAQ